MAIQQDRRLAGLRLAENVTGANILTFYFACLAAIMFASFIPQSQPFLLTEFLGIPQERHGMVSGLLNFWAEIAIIIAVAVFGPLSDRFGRRPVTGFGFLLISAGVALYPHARDISQLLVFRLVYAVGIAAVTTTIVALVADYVRDESRGRATGLQGVMNGVGAMVCVFLLLQLPAILQRGGATAHEAGIQTYSLVAAIAFITGILMLVGLKPGSRVPSEHSESLLSITRNGLRAARDPKIALAYGASFVARGNLMIVGTFFTLWVTNYGTTEMGMSRADALARAGMIVGIAQGCALLGAPLFGIMADKITRVRALIIALLVSAIGYGSTIFITDPFSTGMIVCAVLIGLGEIGCIITSGVLIAQQAPESHRGAVIGFFTLSGAVGILVASVVGGYLFDTWRASGPFVFFALVAALVLVWAVVLERRSASRDAQAQMLVDPA
ncbi:MFS transporter [Microbulbifer hydrolyticus]|uniref:MFS family permease n=1 Tax=Microbulbifer hydrolyticus TaxID=48074 RepID=A0A6P1T957_9GAMM|nr:MFS transporter [Microbulbifer hydrolyticus]MBB5210145.1 MFS family permease [Microbulbifer hydrolyticus]QHQ39338.1 MFS transporter [Microbulbifer hydrolyticus]